MSNDIRKISRRERFSKRTVINSYHLTPLTTPLRRSVTVRMSLRHSLLSRKHDERGRTPGSLNSPLGLNLSLDASTHKTPSIPSEVLVLANSASRQRWLVGRLNAMNGARTSPLLRWKRRYHSVSSTRVLPSPAYVIRGIPRTIS